MNASPIRIAYIVHSFDRGGLERCVARLANHLDPDRFQPLIIPLTHNGAAEEWIERPAVPIVPLHKPEHRSWKFHRRFARTLQNLKVDIVHSHNWSTLMETAVARRLARIPIHVHAQRGMFYHGHSDPVWKQWLRRQGTRWAIRRAQSLVAVADSVRDYWLEMFGHPGTPIHVITNGVDVPPHDATRAQALRCSLGIAPAEFLVGSVGRLVPVKAFDNLIDAVAAARSRHLPVRLLIVGDGPERERLQQHAASAGIAQAVHFVGEQMNVGDWLAAMQLYVNCSVSEGMSQSVLEAMAVGRPLLVTDAGENRALVSGMQPCGDVVPIGHPELLAAGLERFVTSPTLCEEYQRNARQRHASRYSVSRMIREYDELYCRLMQGQSHALPLPSSQPLRQAVSGGHST